MSGKGEEEGGILQHLAPKSTTGLDTFLSIKLDNIPISKYYPDFTDRKMEAPVAP